MSRQALQAIEESKAIGSALVLLRCLADAMNSITGESWLALATMAQRTSLSEREVRYSLRELEASGELSVKPGAGHHRTNVYTLGPNYAPNLSTSDPKTLSDPKDIDIRIGGKDTESGGHRGARLDNNEEGDYSITTCPKCGGWFYSEHLGHKLVDNCGAHCKDWT